MNNQYINAVNSINDNYNNLVYNLDCEWTTSDRSSRHNVVNINGWISNGVYKTNTTAD